MADLWGCADLHCHPMAHLGFGGKQNNKRLFWGEPSGALDQALPCCGASHSLWNSFMPFLVEEKHGQHGHPGFADWPRATTMIHQQMYWEWIQRAHASGLRLLCALAVNNEYLPHLFHGGFHAKNSDTAAIGLSKYTSFLCLICSSVADQHRRIEGENSPRRNASIAPAGRPDRRSDPRSAST